MKKFTTWWFVMVAMLGMVNLAKADETGQVTQLPPMRVFPDALEEALPVGPYQQPKWTAGGQIGGESVYVLPAWSAEFSHRWFPELGRDHVFDNAFQDEIEVGLPHRFQADFNENWGVDHVGSVQHRGIGLEARYALADWGVIPLNPTFYVEWEFNNSNSEHGIGDAYELKFLLAEQFRERWHWAFNFAHEQQVGGERTTEFRVTQALAYSLIDDKLAAGVEMKFEHTTEIGGRSDPEIEFLLGPSLSWRPTKNTHLDFVPLFGLTHDAPIMEAVVVFGVEFGSGAGSHEGTAPASMKGR